VEFLLLVPLLFLPRWENFYSHRHGRNCRCPVCDAMLPGWKLKESYIRR
jgi:hypothetical protein